MLNGRREPRIALAFPDFKVFNNQKIILFFCGIIYFLIQFLVMTYLEKVEIKSCSTFLIL